MRDDRIECLPATNVRPLGRVSEGCRLHRTQVQPLSPELICPWLDRRQIEFERTAEREVRGVTCFGEGDRITCDGEGKS